MPVNADPVRVVVRRTVATQGDLFGEASSGAPEVAGVVETAWIPHWQTCTDPKRWRTKNTPT